jgi:tetratricopeptide (TPR) repeat protein
MIDFFVSYNGADRSWAEWIAWHLEQAGYSTVLQAWDFRPGSNFVLGMQKAAAEAARTIAVLSPSYLAARFTQPEWAAAFVQDPTGEKGTLVPVCVRECELTGLWPAIVYIDLVGLAEDAARDALLAGIRHERRRPAAPPPFPAVKPPRFPGSLPPIWNVPHLRNRNFTGRDQLLDDLRTALSSGRPAALTQAITGLGGVGKTQLAVEYAYRHATGYACVWWARAEEPATLAADYAALAVPLGLPEKDAADQRTTVEAVRLWLGRNPGWLLVLDNANDPREVRSYLPQGTAGHVLVTSRNPAWAGSAQPLPVAVLPREEAIAFLRKRTGCDDRDAANRLCDAVGDLPLALEQAGAYIESTGITVAEYLSRFESHARELLKTPPSTDYPASVATTWLVAFERLKKEAPGALELLNFLAFLAPDDIPRELVPGDPMKLDQAVAGLRKYSLVEVRGGAFAVHRLVQAVTRDRLANSEAKECAEAALQAVNGAFPYKQDVVETWAGSSRLLPHALVVAKHAEDFDVAPEMTIWLLDNVGLYLQNRAQLSEAEGTLQRALVLAEKVYGHEHPTVAILANNIGMILQDKGDLEGALSYTERALRIAEKVHGPEHPNVAIRANNIGQILQAKGDLEGALRYAERALRIDEKVYGPEHPEVATDANNIGWILQAKGDLEGALRHTERALRIDEKVYGPEHPRVAVRANNIGQILRAKGDLEGALRYTDRALRIDEKVYGAEHPEVARNANNVGAILLDKGDLEGALPHFERAVGIFQSTYGPDHPNTKRVAANLARLQSLIHSKK